MRLPNAEHAVIDAAKLHDYCLNLEHPRGKHKARVFARTLDLTQRDTSWFRKQLLAAARAERAVPGHMDAYGQRYTLDVELTTPAGTATVRSSWIVRTSESVPRLVTCYVL